MDPYSDFSEIFKIQRTRYMWVSKGPEQLQHHKKALRGFLVMVGRVPVITWRARGLEGQFLLIRLRSRATARKLSIFKNFEIFDFWPKNHFDHKFFYKCPFGLGLMSFKCPIVGLKIGLYQYKFKRYLFKLQGSKLSKIWRFLTFLSLWWWLWG